MIKDLDLLVRSAVAEVFDTMLDLEVAYEDAKDWRFSPSFGEALASFGGKELVNA